MPGLILLFFSFPTYPIIPIVLVVPVVTYALPARIVKVYPAYFRAASPEHDRTRNCGLQSGCVNE